MALTNGQVKALTEAGLDPDDYKDATPEDMKYALRKKHPGIRQGEEWREKRLQHLEKLGICEGDTVIANIGKKGQAKEAVVAEITPEGNVRFVRERLGGKTIEYSALSIKEIVSKKGS